MFLDRGKKSVLGTWDYRILRRPDSRFAGVPGSLAQYEQERSFKWANIAGVVSTGTRIKVTSIRLERNPEMGRAIWVEGLILDGTLSGMKDVELSFISKKTRAKASNVDVPMVDHENLQKVPDNGP
jgi:hypothetical protein